VDYGSGTIKEKLVIIAGGQNATMRFFGSRRRIWGLLVGDSPESASRNGALPCRSKPNLGSVLILASRPEMLALGKVYIIRYFVKIKKIWAYFGGPDLMPLFSNPSSFV
jgi:hypothetical protein